MSAAQPKENCRMSQPTFAALAYANKKKKTRREIFLEEMEQVVPWAQLLKVIKRYYPKAGNGRPPQGLEKMFRIYSLHQCFTMSHPTIEEPRFVRASRDTLTRIELAQRPADH